jgi:oligoendopeptidase F
MVTAVSSPVIALIAIWINNNRARKRDEKKITNELFCGYFNNVLDGLVKLMNKKSEVGTLFLEYIMAVHQDEGEAEFSKFMIEVSNFQIKARDLTDYANMVFSIADKNIEFDDMKESIDDYAEKFTELIKYHDFLANKGGEPDEILDIVEEKLCKNDKIIIDIFHNHMLEITQVIKETINN